MLGQQDQVTASQISGMVNAHQGDRKTPIGEQTLLSQYKQCNAINDQALRKAKNIKDLVQINVATLDKQLYVQHQGNNNRRGGSIRDETSFNLQFDPLNFLQKVPQMGDREFLINQSILHNSTQKNRFSEAVSRQKFMQQSRGNASHYASGSRHPGSTRSSQPGLAGLLPQLPIETGFSVKVPARGLKSNKTTRNARNFNSQGGKPLGEVPALDNMLVPDEDYEMDSVQLSGRGSQIDPVRCLQNIFRKHEVKKRQPCVNRIAEKYKQESKQHRRNSRMIATANTATHFQGSFGGSFSNARDSLPMTPAANTNFFSQANDRFSLPSHDGVPSQVTAAEVGGETHALLHQKNSTQRNLPPSTAPTGVGRAEIGRSRKNRDIEQGLRNQGGPLSSNNVLQASHGGSVASMGNFGKKNTMPVGSQAKPDFLQVTYDASNPKPSVGRNSSQRSKQFKTQQPFANRKSQPTVSPIVSDELTEAQQAIREKLAAMRQIFDDEEQETHDSIKQRTGGGLGRPDSSEWDLHAHKIEYEETMHKRQQHIDLVEKRKRTSGLSGEIPTKAKKDKAGEDPSKPKQNFEMQEDELRDFLMNRIAELKSADNADTTDLTNGKFKFKASTISNVLPSGHIAEQSRLEQNYKNRFRNKGEKLHQRLINSQQREQEKITNNLRVSHQRTMEQHKKDMVSNRSKDARSPSGGSEPASPLRMMNAISPVDTHFSLGSGSDMRMRSKSNKRNRKRQVNTDLEGDPIIDARSEGLSTQHVSIDVGRRSPLTPLIQNSDAPLPTPLNTKPLYSEMEPQQPEILSEPVEQDIYEQPVEEFEPHQIEGSFVQSQGLQEHLNIPDQTAIVFQLEDDAALPDQEGRNPNYFAKVLRAIEQIDKQHAKVQKLRKQGFKQEALQIIDNARATDPRIAHQYYEAPQPQPVRGHEAHCSITQSQALETAPMQMVNAQVDLNESPAHILQESSQDSEVVDVNALMRKSLEEAVEKLDPASQSKPGDLIILQITEPDEYNVTEKSGKMVNDEKVQMETKLVETDPKTTSIGTFGKSQHSTVDGQRRNDPLSSSLIVQQAVYHQPPQPRKPEGQQTTGQHQQQPPAHSLVIVKHGQKYAEPKMHVQTKTLEDDNKLLKSGRTESAHSYKVDSEEMGEKMGHHVTAPLKTIQGEAEPSSLHGVKNLDIEKSDRMGRYRQEQEIEAPESLMRTNTVDSGSPANLNFAHSFVSGSQLAYFCPKRFNRFPRFTIFFKKGQKQAEGNYVKDNTVSLNADFLKFLSDKRASAANEPNGVKAADRKDTGVPSRAATQDSIAQNVSGQPSIAGVDDQKSQTFGKIPSEVAQWNEYLKMKKFDPFDRVVLVKGIDNQILTSFRTLRGENNTVSDTYKIVHKKFKAGQTNNAYFKNMITRHVDKLPYLTRHQFEDLDEMDDEDLARQYEIFQEQEDGTFQQVQMSTEDQHGKTESQSHIIAVDPSQQHKVDESNFSSAKLQHAMTAALIDIEKDAASSGRKPTLNNQALPEANKSYYRVIKSNDTASLEKGQTHEKNAPAQGRMPKPKPLNIKARPNRSKGRAEAQKEAQGTPERRTLGAPFGVQGVSPLTQLANTMLREQRQNQVQESGSTNQIGQLHDWQHNSSKTGVTNNSPQKSAMNASQFAHNSQIVTQQNSIVQGLGQEQQEAPRMSEKKQNKTKISPVKLIMQPNFQFNSTATVEQAAEGREDYYLKAGASKSGPSLSQVQAHGKVSKRETEATLFQPQAKGTIMGNTGDVLSKRDAQPQPIQQDSSVAQAKKQMLQDGSMAPVASEMHASQRAGDCGVQSDSEVLASQHNITAQGGNLNQSQHAIVDDYQPDFVGQLQASAGMSPPTVNVIRSNTQIGNGEGQNAANSDCADDGCNTKRTGDQLYLIDSNIHAQEHNLDLLQSSPIVHQAIGGRKLFNQSKKYDSCYANSIQWSDAVRSHRSNITQRIGDNTERSSKRTAPKPAEHVGVLKVPESLKNQHFGGDQALEQVATSAARKGAVGSMIDKIYTRDRRMVNNTYKGNMLSTAVLTDMTRYHKLKSNTGVESKFYDEIWLQERIEEEKNDMGLSLDCAPNQSADVAGPGESQPSVAGPRGSFSLSKQGHKHDSIAGIRQSLGGHLGEHQRTSQGESGEAVNYAEIVNRSDNDTALGKPNYH